MVHIDSIRNVVGEKSIYLESDGILDNEWLEAREETPGWWLDPRQGHFGNRC
jgi:hypothetical protein